jgi:hypothetical protein
MKAYNGRMKTFACNCHWCGAPLIRKQQSVVVKYHFCNNYCKAQHQRTAKPVTKEWLYDHYIIQGMNTTQIAHIVKRDPKSVWNWLKDLEIPTRKRGYACEHLFQKGTTLWLGRNHTKESRKKMSDTAKREGRVPYNPAVGSYMKGRKGSNTPNWKGGITPERQATYSSVEWCTAAKTVWRRDRATCQRCGIKKNDARDMPFDLHHIVSFENKERRTDPNNLVLLCEPCHYWTHGKKNTRKEFVRCQ